MNEDKTKDIVDSFKSILLWNIKQIKKTEDDNIIDILIKSISQIQGLLVKLRNQGLSLDDFLKKFIYSNDRLDVKEERIRLINQIKSGEFDEHLNQRLLSDW